MRFKKAKLIATIDNEIAARQKAAKDAHAEAVKRWEVGKVEYLASEHPQKLSDAAKRVVEKVRKGRLVTSDDLSHLGKSWGSQYEHLYSGGERPTEKRPDIAQLASLRRFLDTVSDDEVTSSGLRDVGFRDLGAILRKAAV